MNDFNFLDYYWKPEEIITGDKFEALCYYIFDIDNYINGNHGRKKYNGSKDQLIDQQLKEINDKQPKIIFVYGHDIQIFFSILNKINHTFKVVSHNSDIGVDESSIKFIEDEKIIKWYAMTNKTLHDKIATLPAGIARKEYVHGNLELLSEITKNNKKDILVYKNFSIHTNIKERTEINNITNNNKIFMSNIVPFNKYLQYVSRSIFIISPPGNAIESHRTWESLYLKAIPIVKRDMALKQFDQLPIFFIDNWEEITIDFLRKNVNKIEGVKEKIKELNFKYWENKIKYE